MQPHDIATSPSLRRTANMPGSVAATVAMHLRRQDVGKEASAPPHSCAPDNGCVQQQSNGNNASTLPGLPAAAAPDAVSAFLNGMHHAGHQSPLAFVPQRDHPQPCPTHRSADMQVPGIHQMPATGPAPLQSYAPAATTHSASVLAATCRQPALEVANACPSRVSLIASVLAPAAQNSAPRTCGRTVQLAAAAASEAQLPGQQQGESCTEPCNRVVRINVQH